MKNIKIKELQTTLNTIDAKNISSSKVALFKKTILTAFNNELNILDEKTPNLKENQTEAFICKFQVIINLKKLVQDWNNLPIIFSTDYILNNYLTFENIEGNDFDELIKKIDLSEYLFQNNFITNRTIWIVGTWVFDINKHEYNKQTTEYPFENVGGFCFWNDKDILKKEIDNNNPLYHLKENQHSSV